VARTLQSKERSEAGAFTPVARPRLLERLTQVAAYPVALLVAPAGYGKSVTLRQYVESLAGPNARFTLRPEHVGLLAFLRGFSEAVREWAPHAITALAGAYERSSTSPKRAVELARWVSAHLEGVSGTVLIDDFHVAEGDPEVASFLTALIEQTKPRIRWIIALRSTIGLPVGTWQAYGDAGALLNEHDLRFTFDEAQDAADGLRLSIGASELKNLLSLTEGWPAAMIFALRTSLRSSELRNVSAMTREMIYRLLAEQVYAALDEDERSLLEVAVALPVIAVNVLERAGFDKALIIVERLRERTAFIYEDAPGVYQCHDLFREFLCHQTALAGKRSQQSVHERAARALEASGDVEHAMASFVTAGSAADIVRLLELHGFDLLERARGDLVARAIEALDERTRRDNATLLALHAALQAIAGKFGRAESLFQRALARAGDKRDLIAIVSLRLASLLANQGRAVTKILERVADDDGQKSDYSAEALSLIAAQQAMAGKAVPSSALTTLAEVLPEIEPEATRARVLHNLGVANRHTGDVAEAFEKLVQASEIANDLHLYSLAGRTYAVLSNLSLHEEDDVKGQLEYAQLAVTMATMAGDVFGMRTALLQMLSAHMRRAEIELSLVVEKAILDLPPDAMTGKYLGVFRAVRLAWEDRFSEAHWGFSKNWTDLPESVDRIASRAQDALVLALDGQRDAAIKCIDQVMGLVSSEEVSGRFGARSIAASRVFCAFAELANGRATNAQRLLQQLEMSDVIERTMLRICRLVMHALRTRRSEDWDRAQLVLGELANLDHGDVAAFLTSATRTLRGRQDSAENKDALTQSERSVLRLLASGLVPKEIAQETQRSVNTIRAHIANAIVKLKCHGRLEAIEVARRDGLL
jgi:DNA-binding CsgD family transcriptional regulator